MNPVNATNGLEGFAPTYQRVSDFQFGDMVTFTSVAQEVISLNVPQKTPNRKIYAWLWVNNSQSTYYAKGVITFYRDNSKMGQLPICIGGGTLTQSLASVCTTSGSNVQDCLGVYLANPTGTQPTSLILQPLYIYGEFDRLTFAVTDISNVTSMRALLACTSSQ